MKQQFEFGQLVGECIYLRDVESTKLRKCEFECARCGKVFIADLADVKRKRIQSCGCYNLQRVQETHTRHGQSRRGSVSKSYSTYAAMLARCYNPNNWKYADYGGRGITVCDRWRESFENFYKDMGDRPEGYTIDRIDNNAGYSPDNCKWATQSEQCRNRRSNRIIEYEGEKKTLIDWSENIGIEWKVLDDRLRRKWSVERAFTETVGRGSNNPKPVNQYALSGEFVKTWSSIKEISEHYKVDKSCISEACTGKIAKSRGFLWRYAEE